VNNAENQRQESQVWAVVAQPKNDRDLDKSTIFARDQQADD
jgi:hypothetical protein